MVNDPARPVGSRQEIDARLHRCSEAQLRPGVRPLDTAALGPVKFDPSKRPRCSDEALQAARSWYARTFACDRAGVMRGEHDGRPFLQGYAACYDEMRQPLMLHVPYMVDDRQTVRTPCAEGLEPCPHGDTEPGPRIPLAYGSAATLVCKGCGSWRQDRPGFSDRDWQPPAELERALANDDERE